MGKVYAVTTGSYSDYCIAAVFSSREKAQEYIDAFSPKVINTPTDFNDIEEWEVDDKDCALLVWGASQQYLHGQKRLCGVRAFIRQDVPESKVEKCDWCDDTAYYSAYGRTEAEALSKLNALIAADLITKAGV